MSQQYQRIANERIGACPRRRDRLLIGVAAPLSAPAHRVLIDQRKARTRCHRPALTAESIVERGVVGIDRVAAVIGVLRVALEEVAGRIEGVGVGRARCRLVALRQTRRPPAIGAEEGARAVEFGDDMPAIVEEVVACAGNARLLPGAQPVGSIACGESGAELRQAVLGVPGKRGVDACPVVEGRVALPVVGTTQWRLGTVGCVCNLPCQGFS